MQPSGLVVLLCILYNQTMEPTQDATKENIFNDDIQTIISLMDTKPSDDAHELISRAYTFAKDAHKEQKRASGEPYFNHLVATAQNLARYGMDPVTIAAGLLHDVIEDTPVTEEQLKEKFGDEIVFLVNGVTKLGKVKYQGRERHVESLRKFFVALADDFRVLMIKLADRLHNLHTLRHIRPEKQKRIALEAIEVYAPLANRLGIGKLKGELEDAAFPFAYPKEYQKVEELLKTRIGGMLEQLEIVRKELEEILIKEGIPVVKISARMKHKYSLWRKLLRNEMDIEKIYDIVALRVIVPTIENCYHALGLVHSTWKPLPARIKDYIALPKPNGYQSLHTTIFTGNGYLAEIQIRTREMHAQAEYGIAAHYHYKESMLRSKKPDTAKFSWIEDVSSLDELAEATSPDKFFQILKRDFFKDRIFVFTPQGDVIDLPEDSSPVDFAYAIHSDIGNTVSQAKINGKATKLSTKLKMSDIVEIIPNKNAHPSASWLDFTKTTVARKHIRQYIDEHGGLLDSIMKRFK
jgi:GTP pyrophosphokinase